MTRKRTTADKELSAIASILRALDGLDGESIQRVLDYVFGRLSIAAPSRFKSIASVAAPTVSPATDQTHKGHRPSIRDLKEGKQPESSNQMAALIAYYLSDVVDELERKEAINTADLEKYFKQAGFRLPRHLAQTLPNAAAAGYLDPAGSGLYKLNPVGYNLVVHGLPRTHAVPTRKRKKKQAPRQQGRS